jgi:hypothetical protein
MPDGRPFSCCHMLRSCLYVCSNCGERGAG